MSSKLKTLQATEVDELIAELEGLQSMQNDITSRRREIRAMLEEGRYEGTFRDIRKSARIHRTTLDKDRLRRYVNQRVLDECTKHSTTEGNVTIVAKLKRKQVKAA